MVISKILTYVWRMIIARTGTDAYGLFSIGLAILSIATVASLLGLANGIERYAAYYHGKNEPEKVRGTIITSFKISLALSLVIGTLLFIFAEQLATSLFNKPETAIVIQFMALALPAATLSELCFSTMKALKQIKYAVLSKNVLDSLFKIILAAIPTAMSLGILGLSVGYAIATFITFLTLFYFLDKKVFSITSRTAIKISVTRELVVFSAPLVLVSIISSSFFIIDTIALGILKNATEVGIYNAAAPTATLLLIVPTALLSLFLPLIAGEYAKENKEQIISAYRTVSKWILLVNLPVLFGIILFSHTIILTFFGSDYASATVPLIILSAGYFVLSFFWTSLYLLSMLKKSMHIMIFAIANAGINLALAFLLIPEHGLIGAATSTAVAMTIYGLLLFVGAHNYFRINPLSKKTAFFGVAATTVFGVATALSFGLELNLLEKVFLFLAILLLYSLAAIKLRLIGQMEKEIFTRGLIRIGFKGKL